jgi:uncharacterized protein
MDVLLICIIAFAASLLTFFSGYGLGTILLPAFSLFFPVEVAIAMTAVVHLLNNLFKLGLTYKNIRRDVVLRFGIPSLLAAFLGAWLLTGLAGMESLGSYRLAGRIFYLEPIKLTVGIILLVFALLEWFPGLLGVFQFRGMLFTGGLLSGFFGGLTGNQGALRSAFLIRLNLDKKSFIATGVMVACMVDVARLLVYSGRLTTLRNVEDYRLIMFATLAAFAGAYFGNQLLKKITLESLQIFVAILLVFYSVLLMLGII